MTNRLPTMDEFLKNSLDVIDECDICLEPFDANHVPVRLSGQYMPCHHVFSSNCLRQWIESEQEQSNTCPKCRKVLFSNHRVPNLISGSRDMDHSFVSWVEDIWQREDAKNFARCLWDLLWRTYCYNHIFDSDIEGIINMALNETKEELAMSRPLYLKHRSLPAVMQIAKEMISVQYGRGRFDEMDNDALRRIWMPKLEEALDWKLEEDDGIDPDSL